MKFCNEIEQFVSAKSMQDWWNHGVHEKALSTYSFLVSWSIPKRLGLIQVRSWQAHIHGMLKCIPSVAPSVFDLNLYFRPINSKLSYYKDLREAPMLLEQAVRYSRITKQYDENNDPIISLNVLSFL